MRKAVDVGLYQFDSKIELSGFIVEIIRHHMDRGVVAKELNDFLLALLMRHPDWHQKIGCGVSHFSVQRNPSRTMYGEFHLHRTDGTSTDFSYRKCLTNPSKQQQVQQACRIAVRGQIEAFRKVSRGTSGTSGFDVHHAKPEFKKLVEDFLTSVGLTYDDVTVVPSGDNKQGYRLADQRLSAWVDYHRDHANLRLVSFDQHRHMHKKP